MATSRIKITTSDENATSRLNAQLKNKAVLTNHTNLTTAENEPQRRVALGGLTNNQIQPKNVGNRVLKPNLKEVKPKVDTHWKRNEAFVAPFSSAVAAKRTVAAVAPTTTATVMAAQRLAAEAKQAAVAAAAIAPAPSTTSHAVADAVKRVTSKCSSSAAGIRPAVTALFKKASAGAISMPAAEQIAKTLSHSTRQLGNHVEDIDAQDRDNPFLMSEYAVDIYNYLQDLEKRYPIREGFLDKHDEISARMRSVLIDWINEVHFQFKLLPETYFMAIGLIDRYLQKDKHVARRNLQLVGATALFVAAKYEELYPPVLADFVYITDNTYTDAQVIEMEKRMLSALKFELCPPLAIHFLRRYSKAALSEPITHTLAKYLIELSTIDYQMCQYSPSLKAAAALYLSLIVLKTKTSLAEIRFIESWKGRNCGMRSSPQAVPLWTPSLAYYSNYSEAELRPVVQKLAVLVLAAPKTKSCRAIHNKYSLHKFEKCANLPELSGNLMKTLAADWTSAEDTVTAAHHQ